ncbi:MAG: leucine-rich repeat protein [Clostridia bacterium]|nr:leucine-rich repeat protein [Clostridia bacterium]
MKKRLLLLTVLAFVLSACLAFASCDKPSRYDENNPVSGSSSQNTDSSQNDDQKDDDSQDKEQTPEYVTVTFDTKGGSIIESVQVTKGEKISKPQDPQKYAHTFDGWYLDDEKWSFENNTVTQSLTLTSKWVPTTYTITYVGNVTHTNKTTYTPEDDSFDLDGSAKERYYEFLGWYEDEKFKKPISKIEKGTVGNKTLYAKIEYNPVILELIGGSYKVVDCDKKATSVVVPSTYKGKPVTSIGDSAFEDCNGLTSVEIPNSVTTIGEGAFRYCTSLTSIEIPKSVTKIDKMAFLQCKRLIIYYESKSEPDWLSIHWNYSNCPVVWDCKNNDEASDGYIYEVVDGIRYALKDGKAIVERQLSNTKDVIVKAKITRNGTSYTVRFIGSGAFSDCTSLASIEIPNGVTTIFASAFLNCTSLTSVEIPNSVTSIGGSAFSNCTSLTSIEIPNSVTRIYGGAFDGCTRLIIYCEATSQPDGWDANWNYSNCPVVWNCNNNDVANDGYIYTVIDGVRYGIKDGAATVVRQPINIKEAIIKEIITYKNASYPVTSIGGDAFYDCDSLASVTIGDSVKSIGDYAFYGCTSLTSIEIPNSVTSIGWAAFSGCTSLTIYCEATSKPSGWDTKWNYSNCPVVWGHGQGE